MTLTARTAVYAALALFGGSTEPPIRHTTECNVKGVYKTLDAPPGTISLSGLGEIQEVDQLLAPAKLASGSYDVSVTRKAKDLYRVDGTGTYILTRYCYEYVYSQKAVLRYTGGAVFSAGALEFDK